MVETEISYNTITDERIKLYLVININKSCRIRSMGLCEKDKGIMPA